VEIIKPSQKPYIFLDEIQNVQKCEKFVRSIQEKKEAFFLITGSSSKLLSKELASILTGRQLYFEIFPLKTLVHFYLSNISSLISFNKISKFINLPVETIRRFSSYLETSNLIFFVKRFSYSLKEQENSPRKVYSIDTGLSETVGFKFSRNSGKLLENVVALKLKQIVSQNPFLEIYYWKNQYGDREVDFLIKKGGLIKSLIQACWNVEEIGVKERESKGLLKAMDEFNLKEGIIITEDFETEEKIKDKKIIYQPIWKWLLAQ